MNLTNNDIRALYDRSVRIPLLWYIDTLFGRATESSPYRKKAVSSLHLTKTAAVLDVACGTGLNFNIIESYVKNSGKIVGVDISSSVLKKAQERIKAHRWTNIELVHADIAQYESDIRFDAALCTFALSIIPHYKDAINNIVNLLNPQGRFVVLGMKSSSHVYTYIKSKFAKIDYKEVFGGFYYILSASKLSSVD